VKQAGRAGRIREAPDSTIRAGEEFTSSSRRHGLRFAKSLRGDPRWRSGRPADTRPTGERKRAPSVVACAIILDEPGSVFCCIRRARLRTRPAGERSRVSQKQWFVEHQRPSETHHGPVEAAQYNLFEHFLKRWRLAQARTRATTSCSRRLGRMDPPSRPRNRFYAVPHADGMTIDAANAARRFARQRRRRLGRVRCAAATSRLTRAPTMPLAFANTLCRMRTISLARPPDERGRAPAHGALAGIEL